MQRGRKLSRHEDHEAVISEVIMSNIRVVSRRDIDWDSLEETTQAFKKHTFLGLLR